MQQLKHLLACTLGILLLTAVHAQPNITRVEYYVDIDPGYGKAIAVPGISGGDINKKAININIDTLSAGLHLFGIRAKDALGKWSLDNSWIFLKADSSFNTIPNITRVEYFIDKDPGYGKGIEIAIDNSKDLNQTKLFVNVSTLQVGKHKIAIRSRDGKGKWSLNNLDSFTVSTLVNATSITTASISSKSICSAGAVKVGYQKQGTFANGNIFKVQLSDSSGNFQLNPSVIGSITDTTNNVITCTIPAGLKGTRFKVRVVSTSPELTSDNFIDSIVINTAPNKPNIIALGNTQNLCTKDSVTLSTATAITYLWSNGDTTKNTVIDTAGNYTVTISNNNGCTATSDATSVTYQPRATPTGLSATSVTATKATLNWTATNCAIGYQYQYRKKNTVAWTSGIVLTTNKNLIGLTPATTYQWRVIAGFKIKDADTLVSDNGYSIISEFTTLASFAVATSTEPLQLQNKGFVAELYPNPAKNFVYVKVNNLTHKGIITLADVSGKKIWQDELKGNRTVAIPVKYLATGIYFIIVKNVDNISVTKFLKE